MNKWSDETWLCKHTLKRTYSVTDELGINVDIFGAFYFMVVNLNKNSLQKNLEIRFTVGDPKFIFILKADLVEL